MKFANYECLTRILQKGYNASGRLAMKRSVKRYLTEKQLDSQWISSATRSKGLDTGPSSKESLHRWTARRCVSDGTWARRSGEMEAICLVPVWMKPKRREILFVFWETMAGNVVWSNQTGPKTRTSTCLTNKRKNRCSGKRRPPVMLAWQWAGCGTSEEFRSCFLKFISSGFDDSVVIR